MLHEAGIVVAFILCEACFQQVEHWFNGWRVGLRGVHHGAFVAWFIHPSVATGAGEWVMHLVAKIAS